MRGLRLSELTCSRLPCWEGAGLGLQLRTGLWMLRWSGVSPHFISLPAQKRGRGPELRQGRALAIGCTASALHRPGQEAELGPKTSLSSACHTVQLGAEVPSGFQAAWEQPYLDWRSGFATCLQVVQSLGASDFSSRKWGNNINRVMRIKWDEVMDLQ